MSFNTVRWSEENGGAVILLDQTKLPNKEEYLVCTTPDEVIRGIRALSVRGAPAIGVAGAYAVALAARRCAQDDARAFHEAMKKELAAIRAARPTAVNLPWAVDRMAQVLNRHEAVADAQVALLGEARRIDQEDVDACRALGRHGAALIADGNTVLTHCNAGALATAGRGTALSVVYEAVESGKRVRVISDETRPLLQGARLTAWECQKMGVPVTVICDNAAGWILSQGKVNCIVVGADRIAANGDVANKIGTYPLAVLAREHKIPFYVAAPTSTLDLSIASGKQIPIEERAPEEVTHPRGTQVAPNGVEVMNPAFDVTPAHLVTAIITEKGVVRPPYDLAKTFGEAKPSRSLA
ncbi:MAG TPA: S-methyl-5-thioribose-1-phosphate isomerase [bacterium]|nr:S-methyl-5-thioribose-1-phosphate isomerase [bacterium]